MTRNAMDPSGAADDAETELQHLRTAASQAHAAAAWAEDAAMAFLELRPGVAVESAVSEAIAEQSEHFAAELRSFWRDTSATVKGALAARDQNA